MPDQDEIAKFLAQDAESLVDQHARKYGVDPSLAKRILKKESALRPDVLTGGRRSKAGAIGPMQLMPGTAKELGVDPSNYEQNIEGGVKYLAQMQKQFGDPAKAAAAYNAGPGAVQKYGGVPPYAETQNYVKSVAGGDDIAEFLANDAQAAPIVAAKPLTRPAKPGPIKTLSRGPVVTPEQRLTQNPSPFSTNEASGFRSEAQRAYERIGGIGSGVSARADAAGRELGKYQQMGTLGQIGYDLKTAGQSAANTLADQIYGLGEVATGITMNDLRPLKEQVEGATLGAVKLGMGSALGPNAAGSAIRARQDEKIAALQRRQQARRANDPYWAGSRETQQNIESRKAVNPSLAAQTVRGGTEAAIGMLPIVAASAAGGGLPAVMGITAAQQDYTKPDDAMANLAGAYLSTKAGQAISPAAATLAQRIGGPANVPTIPREIARRGVEGVAGGLTNTAQYAGTQLATGRPIDTQEAITQGITGAGMGMAMAPGRRATGDMLARDAVQSERPGSMNLQPTPQVDATPQAEGPATYSTRPNAQQTRITKIPQGAEYALLSADPDSPVARTGPKFAPAAEASAQATPAPALPPDNLNGIRILQQGERHQNSRNSRVATLTMANPDGSVRVVRASVPKGISDGQAKKIILGAEKAQAKAATQPTTEPLTPKTPAQVNQRQAARNENIQKAHEDSIAARTQAEAARREGRHDEAIRALTVEAEALRALRKQIPDRSRGGRVRRVEAGERLTQIQSEIKAAKIAQRQAVKAADAPTADLTAPIVPDAPQTARMPETPNRITADLPRPMPRTTAEIPRPVAAPLTEPTNRLRNADYPGGEVPRTAGLRPEGQPVEVPQKQTLPGNADDLIAFTKSDVIEPVSGATQRGGDYYNQIFKTLPDGELIRYIQWAKGPDGTRHASRFLASDAAAELRSRGVPVDEIEWQGRTLTPNAEDAPTGPLTNSTNRLPGAEYAGGEVRTYQQPQAEGQPVDMSRRPPAPPRPVGPRSVKSGPQGQYGPTTMSAAFPRSRRGLVMEGRRVQGEIEAGRGDKGEYGKLAQSMFKSTRGDVLHGQDSFFHDADVKGALGLTRDAEQGEVRAALKTELARVMGVKSEEVSLTQVPPQAWQNWAGMKQLGEGARAKLQVAIQKYQSPILDELQKTTNPPDSSPPRPVPTDAGSTPKAPSDYQRLRDANAKAIAALNSVSAANAATPGGKRKFDAAADRLRKSAKQMGIDPSHADAIITDAMSAQMESARRADDAPRPVEATPAQEAPQEAPAKAKEPWEMTIGEFVPFDRKREQDLNKKIRQLEESVERGDKKIGSMSAMVPPAIQADVQKSLNRTVRTPLDELREERAAMYRDASAKQDAHENAVKQALAEGKPVPAEVLADYPDLAPKAPDAPPAAETRPRAVSEAEAAPMATGDAPAPKETYAEEMKRRANEQYAGWKGREAEATPAPKAKRTRKAKPAPEAAPPAAPAKRPVLPRYDDQKMVSRTDMEADLRRIGLKPDARREIMEEYKAAPFTYTVRRGKADNLTGAEKSDRTGYAYRSEDASAMIEAAYKRVHGEDAYAQARKESDEARTSFEATRVAQQEAEAARVAEEREAYRDDDVYAYQKEKVAGLERDLEKAQSPAAKRAIAAEIEKAKAKLSEIEGVRKESTPAAKSAGKIDGKDVTADEMAVYDAMAKAEPRFADNAAASFSRARQESALSKEAFDKAAISLAEKEIIGLHAHDFPQSLSPEGRAYLVQGDGQEYIAGALRNPRAAVERAGEAKSAIKAESIPAADSLDATSRDIETRFRSYLANNFEEAVARYEKQFGKEINTDNARELSADYAASDEARSRYSPAVHEPSSWFAKELYNRKLAESPKKGENPVVLFTAGGTGAGKTSTLASSVKLNKAVDQSQIIMDGNLNNAKKAIQKIDQALAAGKTVQIAAVYRDPVEAWRNGVLPRAEKRGRAVPIDIHVATHAEMAESLTDLVRHYAKDPRVEVHFIDNTHGRDKAKDSTLDVFAPIEDTIRLRRQLERELKEAYDAGEISKRVYEGTLASSQNEAGAGRVRADVEAAVNARQGSGRKPQLDRQEQRPGRQANPARSTGQAGAKAVSTDAGGGTGSGRPVSEKTSAGARVRGIESSLKIPRSADSPIRYEVRELGDIQPSHNPFTFEKNHSYRYVNDRDYTSPSNRVDVENATKAGVFDPRLLLSDDPTAANGPPIIHEQGDVLGGNSRTMMLARVYRNHPVDGQKYKDELSRRADMYGLDKAAIARMDQPVLVRVDLSGNQKKSTQKLITDLNIQPGKAMSSTEAATARAKSMPPETMKFISDRLNAEGADATLAMALEGDKGVAVLNRLIDDDVIPRGDRNRYLTDAGKLSVEAKSEIETMLLSRVFRDADQMKRATPEMKNKLVRVAPHVAKLAGTDWDIAKYIPNAIQAAAESKAQKIDLEMLNRRGHLFGDGIEYKPEELAIARWIGELGPRQLENRFREYATAYDDFNRGQSLFGAPPSARESFDTIFKPARTGKEGDGGLSFGELDRDESNGPLFGSGFGALQGAFKSKPPTGADLDAWMDRMGNAIPETMTDAQISRFDDLVNRAADAAEAGNAREWRRLSRQAEQMVFTRKDRAIAEVSGAMNATRSLMASGDLSAPLRQGAILTLPPSQWGKAGRAAKRMFQALSAGKYERLKQEIQVHPDFDAAEEAGLYLATNDSGRTRGEEDFLRNNSLASRIVERMPVLAHSERAYKMYLDSLRIDTFAKYKHVIEKGGGTDEQKAKALKSAAEWINVATGRGSLGKKFDESVPLLSTIFFAPRYTASRIQVLNPATYAKNLGNPANRQVFRRQMSELFQSAAILTTTAALAKYGLGATVNLDDPESPDWLKIKIGDTRYDVGAGLQQIARLGARIGKYLDTSARGTEKEQGAASDKMVRAVKTFGRSKLGPVPSFFVDWLNNWTNVIGERHTPGEASTKNPIVSRITPLLWADMVDAYREGGAGKAARFTPGVFGVGVQDYDVNKKRKAETKARARPKTPPMPGPPKGFGEL